MASNTTRDENATQKAMFNDPDFAKRYKLGELLTGQFAQDLLNQLGLPSQQSPVHFLDLACGTGIVTRKAIETLNEARSTQTLSKDDKFTCADLAPAMMDVMRARIGEENWAIDKPQIEILEANMTDTKLPSDKYTHLGCNFGPGLAPHPEKTLAESYRMLKSGGVAGWTFWQWVGWFPDMQKAMVEIRGNAQQKVKDGSASEDQKKLAHLPPFVKFEEFVAKLAHVDLKQNPEARWEDAGFVKSQLEKIGFVDVRVEVEKKDIWMDTKNAYQMVRPMVSLIKTFWSEEERKNIENVDFQGPMDAWWERRFQQDDIKDGKMQWKDFTALVATAKKP